MKKLTKGLLGVILFALMALCACFAIPKRAIRARAEGTSISITSTITTFKTSDTGKEFTLGVVMNNSTGAALFGAQATVQFNTTYFEYVGFVKSTQISNSYQGNKSNTATGTIIVAGDNNNQPIPATLTSFTVGSIKLKIKTGITSGTVNDIITVSGVKAPNMSGIDTKPTVQNTYQNITFAEPSNACDITELKVNNETLTPSGNNYSCKVPYSYNKLACAVKVSAGATCTPPTPNLNVGPNTVTLTVTAEDKVTTKTYTLKITRAEGDTRKALTSLKLLVKGGRTIVEKSAADLTSAATFDAGEIPFADKDMLRVELAQESNLSTAQVFIGSTSKGNASKGNVSVDLGTLNAGVSHTLTVKVTPEDGSAANEYKITFTVKAAEEGATLSKLELKIVKAGGEEEPVNYDVVSPTTYTVNVPQGTTKVKVEATAAGEFATIDDGGRDYSKEHNVPGTITITVKSQSGEKTDYTITVGFIKDTSGLTLTNVSAVGLKKDGNTVISEHVLTIENTSVDDYFTVSVPFTLDITHFKIKADEFVSDEYRVEGINYDIDINRAATVKHLVRFIKNNIVEKTITYDIIYESNVKTLSRLTYGGTEVDLSTGLNYFFVEVGKSTNETRIEPTTTDPNAKATVISILTDSGTPAAGSRTVNLAGGINPILITVKATNGDEGTYVLCIMRPLGSQLLTKLECEDENLFKDGEVNDNSKTYYYEAKNDSVFIKANAVDGATITLYDSHMNELGLSDEVKLSGGNNPYFIKVEAQDGTVSGYTVNIYREASSTNNSMPFIVAIIVISVVAVLVIIALTVVIIVNRRKA